MNRIDRLTAILIQLQTKPWITASEIADRYEVSLRTIYRDIRSLEEAGVPIGSAPGRGYFIVDGYHLPPVMFTREEAGAMVIAGKLIDTLTDKSLQTAYATAIDKVKSVVPDSMKETLSDLDEQVVIYHQKNVAGKDYPNNYLITIQHALTENKCLKMDYHAGYNLEKTKGRIIDPLGLVYYGDGWHLIGHCKLRDDLRDFRIDRIQDLQVVSDCASPKDPVALKEYIKNMGKDIKLTEVKVWFHERVLSALNPSKYYFGFIDEQRQDDGAILSFAVTDYKYIASWLLSFTDMCRVVSPKKLQNQMVETVKKLAEVYIEELVFSQQIQ